jgi:hypothetical protein
MQGMAVEAPTRLKESAVEAWRRIARSALVFGRKKSCALLGLGFAHKVKERAHRSATSLSLSTEPSMAVTGAGC